MIRERLPIIRGTRLSWSCMRGWAKTIPHMLKHYNSEWRMINDEQGNTHELKAVHVFQNKVENW